MSRQSTLPFVAPKRQRTATAAAAAAAAPPSSAPTGSSASAPIVLDDDDEADSELKAAIAESLRSSVAASSSASSATAAAASASSDAPSQTHKGAGAAAAAPTSAASSSSASSSSLSAAADAAGAVWEAWERHVFATYSADIRQHIFDLHTHRMNVHSGFAHCSKDSPYALAADRAAGGALLAEAERGLVPAKQWEDLITQMEDAEDAEDAENAKQPVQAKRKRKPSQTRKGVGAAAAGSVASAAPTSAASASSSSSSSPASSLAAAADAAGAAWEAWERHVRADYSGEHAFHILDLHTHRMNVHNGFAACSEVSAEALDVDRATGGALIAEVERGLVHTKLWWDLMTDPEHKGNEENTENVESAKRPTQTKRKRNPSQTRKGAGAAAAGSAASAAPSSAASSSSSSPSSSLSAAAEAAGAAWEAWERHVLSTYTADIRQHIFDLHTHRLNVHNGFAHCSKDSSYALAADRAAGGALLAEAERGLVPTKLWWDLSKQMEAAKWEVVNKQAQQAAQTKGKHKPRK